jgi:hypothetical protein
MNILGATRSAATNVAQPETEALSKGVDATSAKAPEATFRKVYDTTERSLGRVAPSTTPSTRIEPPAVLSVADDAAFTVFVEANRRTESGGVAAFSTLVTTAGPEHRASFGVAQLTMREQLSRMAQLDDAGLRALGTSHAEVDAMRSRGDAAIAYYHLLVDGAAPETSRATLRMTREDALRAGQLAESGDVQGITAMLGAGFTEATGLPESALADLTATRSLRSRELRADFRAQYEHDHGVPFDAAERDPARMIVTARHVALSHPELDRTMTALGHDDAGALALGHYLGVGDTAENMLGWHSRAASSAVGSERFGALLALADPITSHARETDDFSRALAATAAATDLEGDARVALLARLGRLFHGAPARARERFFVDGALDAPRFTSRATLEAAVDEMRQGRSWSDDRLLANVSDVLAERRLT